MKIAVYAIAKNESKFVERFVASARAADLIVIADTGSTDDTVGKAAALGVRVGLQYVHPWRFDVARNKAMGMVPPDFDWIVCLDLDEVLVEGWREKLEQAAVSGATAMNHNYVWSWKEDGTPDHSFICSRVNSRHGYKWYHPCHEIQVWVGPGQEKKVWSDLLIHHHPDKTKSRSSYLGLLETAVAEDPNDPRSAFYLGREYYFWNQRDKSTEALTKYLALPSATWPQERAAAMRLISENFCAQGKSEERLSWLLRACAECPQVREPWLDLAQCCYDTRDYAGCYFAASKALQINNRPSVYLTKEESFGARPYDLASVGAWYLGLREQAVKLAEQAVAFEPKNDRLVKNLELLRGG